MICFSRERMKFHCVNVTVLFLIKCSSMAATKKKKFNHTFRNMWNEEYFLLSLQELMLDRLQLKYLF